MPTLAPAILSSAARFAIVNYYAHTIIPFHPKEVRFAQCDQLRAARSEEAGRA